MDAKSYTDFTLSVHRHYFGFRAPIDVSIEVTRRCPLTCLHCYNNLAMGDAAARGREMSLQEYTRLLDELAEIGCLWILFTGGEIFARKDFLDIYTYAKKKGFLITLFTNGTLISERIADHLAEWRPFVVEITLYGRSRETYEALTGVPGSYDRCIRGIQFLQDRRVPLKLKTVPTSINKHEVYGMQAFAAELGVEFKFDAEINPRLDCSSSPLAVRLSPEEAVALDMHDEKRVGEYQALLSRCLTHEPKDNGGQLYLCGGGMNSFAINPYGEMSICILSQAQLYDWRRGTVRDGWENFLAQIRAKKETGPSRCSRCRIRSLCGMCPANGELESGNAEKPVEFLCHTAHLRVMSLGGQVPEHGDCEFCSSGHRHAELLESAVRIREKQIDVGSWKAPAAAFPILSQEPTGVGCSGSCGGSGGTGPGIT